MSDSRILRVTGRGIVVAGPDIDTDRIIPARFLKTVTFDGMERGVFADDRQALRDAGRQHPFDRPEFSGASILVVGQNFGCGSSREHAPQALYRWGIRAVVGESFADIFFSNSLMLGLPCVSVSESDSTALMALIESAPASLVSVDLEQQRVTADSRSWSTTMPAHARDALMTGQWDAAGLLLERYDEVAEVERRLPY